MPSYQYRALNQKREEISGEIQAGDPDAALAEVREMGLFPVSLREKFKAPPPPPPAAKGNKKNKGKQSSESPRESWIRTPIIYSVSLKQLIYFTRQFATMQEAGLPILKSLQLLEKQQKPGPFRRTIRDLVASIEGGSTLTEAMSGHPRAFDDMYVKMVAAGEAGGVLEPILRRLVETGEKKLELRRKIISAATYPCLVIVFAYLIFIFIMAIVVPMLVGSVRDSGVPMVGPIGILDNLSHWFIHGLIPGWLKSLVTPVAIILGIVFIRNSSEAGRYLYDLVKLKIPLLAMITRKFTIARFSRILGILIEAGVPIVDSIRISRQISGNAVYTRALASVQEAVRQGEPFTKSLQATHLFDSTVINMVEVGEETGDLDKMLLKLADNYEAEAEMLVTSLTTLLGPLMLISIGLVIGFIIVSMFLAVQDVIFKAL